VQAIDGGFAGSAFGTEEDWSGTGVEGPERSAVPREIALLANTPNPFGSTTKIAFALPSAERVTLAIYDLAGRRVRALVDGARPAGTQGVTWDGTDARGESVPAGIYVYRLRAGSFDQGRRMVLAR